MIGFTRIQVICNTYECLVFLITSEDSSETVLEFDVIPWWNKIVHNSNHWQIWYWFLISLKLHYFICLWHLFISKQLVFRVSNWFYISRAFFIPNCILYLKNILYKSVFRAAQVFLVYIKTNWFIIIRVAQGFRVVQYFLDFSETQCCSKTCSSNPCSSRTHCSKTFFVLCKNLQNHLTRILFSLDLI